MSGVTTDLLTLIFLLKLHKLSICNNKQLNERTPRVFTINFLHYNKEVKSKVP
jgi:hypothetical protein